MTKFFNKFKKSCFWPIFGPFSHLGQNFFSPESPLSRTISHGFLAPCQNSEKTNDTLPRTDRRTNRPYFIGPFRLPPGVQKEILSCNKKHISSYIKDVQLPEIVSDLKVCLGRARLSCTNFTWSILEYLNPNN